MPMYQADVTRRLIETHEVFIEAESEMEALRMIKRREADMLALNEAPFERIVRRLYLGKSSTVTLINRRAPGDAAN